MDKLERPNKPDPAELRPGADLSIWIWFVPIIALVVAVLPLPYSFYMGLRWLVTIAAASLAWKEYELNRRRANSYTLIFGAIALLYNPILPVHLFKLLWIALNLITAAAFFGHYRLRRSND